MKHRLSALVGVVATAAALALPTPAAALGPRIPDPIPTLIPQGDVTVGLRTIAGGFVDPVGTAVAPGRNHSMFVVEQRGKIWEVDTDDAGSAPRLFADLSPLGLDLGCFFIHYDERGLFGLAFSPDYKKSGLLYTYQSQPKPGAPRPAVNQCNLAPYDHDNVVTEWRVDDPRSKHATVDPTSGREVLRMQHPQFNHNGGQLLFGPDRQLYISVGDGGAADDQGPGHVAGGNAQDLGQLLGKILRIDPRRGPDGRAYSIPASNPFVGRPGARGEIFALGFRNPYKMSFDQTTGTLFVADVGQNDVEEIDEVTRGGNYGWPVKEGTFAFDPSTVALPGFVTGDDVAGDFVDPIAEYDHCRGPVSPTLVGPCPAAEGVAVVGGFVYRGHEIKALRGHYVFADYSRSFFASDGRLFYLDDDKKVTELRIEGQPALGTSALGIGQDRRGELYLLGKSGATFGPPPDTGITDQTNTSGVVRRITGTGDDDHGLDD